MRVYVIRRLLLMIPTLFILSILVFVSVRFIPGDVIDAMLGRMNYVGASASIDRETLEQMLGLDVPVYVQYGRWIGGILLDGTLGTSLWGDWTVEEKILGRLPVTVELGVMAMLIGLLIALPVGIYSAIRQDTATDYVGRSVAIIGLATPNFWLGIMVMIYPALWWGWAPPMRLIPFTADPLGNLGMFLIPSLILGTAMAAATMRMTRTMMLEVLRQDYIRTAWSKGLKERLVVMRHAVKNGLIPVVTLVGLQLPILLGGAVIMENIFNLPGLGSLLLLSLSDRDYPMVSGINLLFATGVVVFNLLIDLIYPYLDPRVTYR
ncbi:MAG: ABC transporter permease [Spirochaetaceae bacterium]|nr:ABC transporter permease [Spirochaetaceae bacterium]